MRAKHIVATVLALAPATALAGETTSYSYDAKGRLTQVVHAGGPADGLVSIYSFDAADNRTVMQVTGARGRVIMVPLGRLTPIVIR